MQNQKEEIKYVFQTTEEGDVIPHKTMPGKTMLEVAPGVYTLVFESNPMGSRIFMRPENNFKLPKRLYGNVHSNVERFMKSYEMNDKNLGTLFIGEQGSGKTILLKAMAVKAVEMGFPVILVNDHIPSSALNWFMSTITQQALICFDEFEKMFEKIEDQKGILQLLDGTNTGAKKMYCLTANDRSKVSPHLLNRPSRIRYVMTFNRLDVSTVVDYVQTNLKECKEDDLRAFIHLALCDGSDNGWKSSGGMNFDSMSEYVKEMNQFGDSLNDVLSIMGANGKETWSRFDITSFKDGVMQDRAVGTGDHSGAYMGRDECEISFVTYVTKDDDEMLKDADRYGNGPLKDVRVKLHAGDFVGFGDSYDMLLFAKDGIEYHARYIDTKAFRVVDSEVDTLNAGKSRKASDRLNDLRHQKRQSEMSRLQRNQPQQHPVEPESAATSSDTPEEAPARDSVQTAVRVMIVGPDDLPIGDAPIGKLNNNGVSGQSYGT